MEDEKGSPLGGLIGPSPELDALWGPTAPDDRAAEPALLFEPAPHVLTALPAPLASESILPANGARRGGRSPLSLLALALVVVVGAGGVAAAQIFRSESGDPRAAVASATTTPPASTTPVEVAPTSLPDEAPPDSLPPTATPQPALTSTTLPGLAHPRLSSVEGVALRFVQVIAARDCDGVWAMFSVATQKLFDGFSSDEGMSGRNGFCASLESTSPVKMSVRGPARSTGPNNAAIDLEYQGEVEPLRLLFENGTWRIDLVSELGIDDPENVSSSAQSDLRNGLTAERVEYTDSQRYTDDINRLREIEPALIWRRGIATADAKSGEVYVSQVEAGRIVCLSARSGDGTLFMLKADADGRVTYAAGAIPPTCDSRPLADSW